MSRAKGAQAFGVDVLLQSGLISFSAAHAERKRSAMKARTSPGLDEISPILLQQCTDQLAHPLRESLSHSLPADQILEAWESCDFQVYQSVRTRKL